MMLLFLCLFLPFCEGLLIFVMVNCIRYGNTDKICHYQVRMVADTATAYEKTQEAI